MAEEAVARLRCNSSRAELAEFGSTLVLKTLLTNLVTHPSDERFRKVKLSNAKISRALGRLGAKDVLLAVGFSEANNELAIPSTLSADCIQQAAKGALDVLLSQCGEFLLSAQLCCDEPLRCVCAVPPGQLATGGMDNLVRVYREGEWDSPKVLHGHESRGGVSGVLAVLALTSGTEGDLASAGRDGKIILWRDGAEISRSASHGEGASGTNVHVVSCLGLRSDAVLLSGGWDKTVRASQGGVEIAKLEGHEIAVNAVVGLPSGDVVSGSGDQTIVIWRGSEKLRTLAVGAPVRALCSCGGELVACGANDGFARLWDTASGRQVAEHKVCDAYVLSLAFCESTGELAAGADDGTIAILAVDKSSLHSVQTLQLCGEVYGLAFLQSGDLAAACGDNSCVVWTRHPSREAGLGLRQDFAAKARAMTVAKTAVSGVASGGGGSYDHSFPVELGGQKMSLQWNRGEDAQTVASRFVEANGLDPRHMGDVVTFVHQTQQQAMTSGGVGAAAAGGTRVGGNFDFNYPVEVADGRRLTISWNRGDNPQEVAVAFARQNGGIAANELPDIVSFIAQVSGGPAPVTMQQAAPQASGVSPALQQQAMQQVMEMGFDEASSRAALQATGWSVETAVQRLLG
eukprot:TRINITY_DN34289_c0_g1_i1.p1 TRINITY_DN34289_c0_g1~~TRINITY_DN34289_c0_g1_i1.p1  ORF type:complete len:653 (+),score=125.31 TRINITY_DN34289_c0_g1_i1:71-1960(+)